MPPDDQAAAILPSVIAIFGATGVGKTATSIAIAHHSNGEIVNADSRYMYRHLQTGVAKPTLEEQQGVRHHLLDLFDLDHAITISEVKTLAYAAIDDIVARGRLPILVGGTPLYMNAITQGWSMPEVPPDWDFRAAMESEARERGVEWLYHQVHAVDPVAADRSRANPRRLVRALEVHRATGNSMSSLESRVPPPYRILPIALTMPRAAHYAALDARISVQIEDGFLAEVQHLVDRGYSGSEPAFTSIGYREMLSVLRGDMTLDEAAAAIRHANHRYVRHQSTWLRRRPDLICFDVTEMAWMERVCQTVSAFLEQTGTYDP